MRVRCLDPNDPRWRRYGGKGVTVAKAWADSFEQFYADVGPRPGPGYSLDRVDPDGNYVPGNVRWATNLVQQRNKRTTVMVTYDGERVSRSSWRRNAPACPT